MAHTAHHDPKMMEEIRENDGEVCRKAAIVADLLRTSRHTVFFTGAGISTSTGIADYRGPNGVWTAAAQGRDVKSRPMLSAIPSFTHMAMVRLVQANKLHFVISQNVDGLHRRSGIPAEAMAELHGNSTVEECNACGKRFLRDYYIHSPAGNHFTGRRCSATGCEGYLRDTIINFGENLPTVELNNGFVHSGKADLHICLGSSLTVSPACDMPRSTKEAGGKLVVVNLQRTPLDALADVRLHCTTDDFMQHVMRHLELDVEPFCLRRIACLWRSPANPRLVVASGVDQGSDIPQTLFAQLDAVAAVGPTAAVIATADTRLLDPAFVEVGPEQPVPTALVCHFFGHYDEPAVTLALPADAERCCYALTLAGDSNSVAWRVEQVPVQEATFPNYKKGSGRVSRIDGIAHPLRIPPAHNYTGWFAVTPIKHCEHCESICFQPNATLDPHAACEQCGNVGENMQCLTCFRTLCGRHVSGHMVAHHEATSHPMVVGFADLSFWCYPCEAYIDPSNKHLRLMYHLLHQAKFTEDAPCS